MKAIYNPITGKWYTLKKRGDSMKIRKVRNEEKKTDVETWICENCGQTVRPTDRYCWYCGAEFEPIEE